MENPKYEFDSVAFMTYEFVSEGPKGLIVKRIQFTLITQI